MLMKTSRASTDDRESGRNTSDQDLPIVRPAAVRVNFEAPASLVDKIRNRAMEEGLTLRGFMLKLLAADGLEPDAQDRVDGRTLFAARRARARI